MAYFFRTNITSGTLNVRASANATATVVFTLDKDEVVTASSTSQTSGFIAITRGSQSGYASASYLAQLSYAGTDGSVNISSGSLNIRSCYATTYTAVGSLAKGNTVKVIQTATNGWKLVMNSNQTVCGWCDGTYITASGGTTPPTNPGNYNPSAMDGVRNGVYSLNTNTGASYPTAVQNLKILLNSKGASLTVNTSFDIATKNAVISYQQSVGLTADGDCGQGTLAVLEDTSTTSTWRTGLITAGRLARMGFKKYMLMPDIVSQLNSAVNEFGIKQSRERLCHFLGQCCHESQYGIYVMETSYTPGVGGSKDYSPYYGAGFIQNTHDNQYKDFQTWLRNRNYPSSQYGPVYDADLNSTTSKWATKYVADNFPILVSAWFWSVFKDINGVCDSNENNSSESYRVWQVTRRVYSMNCTEEHAKERIKHYTAARAQFT